MSRCLLIALAALALVLAAPAAGDDLHRQKSQVDSKIARLNDHVATIRKHEDALRAEIDQVSGRIQSLEAQAGDVAARLDTLRQDLALHERRLNLLNQLYEKRTQKLDFLRQQYRTSVQRLNQRLVDIYESSQTDVLGVVLSAGSFDEILDQADYVQQIGEQDRRIATQVKTSRDKVHTEREQTKKARRSVLAETQAIAVRTAQTRRVKEQLDSTRSTLASERDRKRVSLDKLNDPERAQAEEIDALQAESAALAAKIVAAQSAAQRSGTSPSPNPGGFQWPVVGPITSPFGWRWGRMHEGIDIAVPSGTPVHAAAAGTVIYAGWMSGYGNLVAIDHGGGISTAYGHNTSLTVTVGQHVDQGQVISYSGSTGHSTGPHVHFEVRVNGSPRDPLGYL
jgi:murein DD-endopeptidase MepM/ murein hydrolase activator NlpD